jgi:uncharacterized membrane protein HdeD (DUF308 family)
MNRAYSNFWWVYLLRGIFAILFGITTLVLPAAAFSALVIFFAMFMIADGIFAILFSLNAKKAIRSKPWILFMGITGLVAGALLLFNPFISAITLVCFFAFWSFFAGIMEMIRAVSMHKGKRKEAWYVASGILSILVAILLLMDPFSGAVSLGIIFGLYAVVIGISLISLSLKLKKQLGTEQPERRRQREVSLPDRLSNA